jgi:hypothetical protein
MSTGEPRGWRLISKTVMVCQSMRAGRHTIGYMMEIEKSAACQIPYNGMNAPYAVQQSRMSSRQRTMLYSSYLLVRGWSDMALMKNLHGTALDLYDPAVRDSMAYSTGRATLVQLSVDQCGKLLSISSSYLFFLTSVRGPSFHHVICSGWGSIINVAGDLFSFTTPFPSYIIMSNGLIFPFSFSSYAGLFLFSAGF